MVHIDTGCILIRKYKTSQQHKKKSFYSLRETHTQNPVNTKFKDFFSFSYFACKKSHDTKTKKFTVVPMYFTFIHNKDLFGTHKCILCVVSPDEVSFQNKSRDDLFNISKHDSRLAE